MCTGRTSASCSSSPWNNSVRRWLLLPASHCRGRRSAKTMESKTDPRRSCTVITPPPDCFTSSNLHDGNQSLLCHRKLQRTGHSPRFAVQHQRAVTQPRIATKFDRTTLDSVDGQIIETPVSDRVQTGTVPCVNILFLDPFACGCDQTIFDCRQPIDGLRQQPGIGFGLLVALGRVGEKATGRSPFTFGRRSTQRLPPHPFDAGFVVAERPGP